MTVIESAEFDRYWKETLVSAGDGEQALAAAGEIIAAVRREGDSAVRRFSSRFDKSAPERFEVPPSAAAEAWETLRVRNSRLAGALELAADHIRRFASLQRAQLEDFETGIEEGLIAGQRVIPVGRAAIYAPGGRFPLISSVLMGAIPAVSAGVGEVLLGSPPLEDGLPDRRILAAAHIAGVHRIFALGGAQAIAAFALGTETVPRCDIIAGPGNKYVAAAKRILYGEVGIDFIAGPTDVLVITGFSAEAPGPGFPGQDTADLAAADMLAQAEHDPDARARALVPDRETADRILASLRRRLASLPAAAASLDAGGLIVICKNIEEAVRIADTIAPEHLELLFPGCESQAPLFRNYGSLFIGPLAAEVLGDYSAGINHTLPTSGSARFTGGLSARHFLKTVTTLRCSAGPGWEQAVNAAECIALAEGLTGHAESAAARR